MHSFQRVLRNFLLDFGNVDLDLVVVHVLVGTEHRIQEGSDDDHGHDGEEVEAHLTGDEVRPAGTRPEREQ